MHAESIVNTGCNGDYQHWWNTGCGMLILLTIADIKLHLSASDVVPISKRLTATVVLPAPNPTKYHVNVPAVLLARSGPAWL